MNKLFDFLILSLDSPKDFILGFLLGGIATVGFLIFLVD